MNALQELKTIKTITSRNQLSVVRTAIDAINELDERSVHTADLTGSQDMALMSAIVDLKNEQQATKQEVALLREDTNQRLDQTNQRLDQTNQRLDQTNQRLEDTRKEVALLREDTNQRLGQTNQRLEHLEQQQTEMISVLRMIAENTRR